MYNGLQIELQLRLLRPRFSWTRIKGESDVQGGSGNGSVEEGEGSWVGADGGSPEGERSRRRRRGGSGGEDLLALLAQLVLRPDVPVERYGFDPEFAAECGHGGVAVRHRGLGQPHLGLRQRERPAAFASARP